MIPFVGNLSAQDANVLADFAGAAHRILEFGVGGSTQILAHYSAPQTELVSIDTDEYWITRTKENLKRIGVPKNVHFIHWNHQENPLIQAAGEFDFIFVDGLDSLRAKFYNFSWKRLRDGGTIANHDTRRFHDFKIVWDFLPLEDNWLEVDSVRINLQGSNITAVKKVPRREYIDWNSAEGKQPWQYGQGEPPDIF